MRALVNCLIGHQVDCCLFEALGLPCPGLAHGHRTGWIVPVDQRTGNLYRLAAKDDLIVQLWAINTETARPRKLGEIRG